MFSQPYRKRVSHYDPPGDAHLLTFSCYGRMRLLTKDRTRRWFVDALEKARHRHEFDLWAWVIMPEHVHLLIYPQHAVYRTKSILKSIKQPVGSKAIGYLRLRSPAFLERLTVRTRNRVRRRFWQAGPGWDQNLNSVSTVHIAIDYIHQNPVRRGLVKRATEWDWSSAKDWAGLPQRYLTVDRTVPGLHPDEQ